LKVTRRSLSAMVLSGLLALAIAGPAAATHKTQHQVGGAAGLVAAVVQVQTGDVDVRVLNRSLNNLLRNADIDVLNNVLNNTLRDADIDITITDILQDNTVVVSVLSGGSWIGDITVSR
jgi:hypothetical protein